MDHRWDDRYASEEPLDRPPEELVIAFSGAGPAGVALDLACGLGRHSLYLASHGWSVTAVDSSVVALNILSERAAEGLPVTVVHADLEAGGFPIEPDSWDLIVDCCYLQRSLFPFIRAGLKPGGRFIGVFPMSGINLAYRMRPGEGRELFGDWNLLHYAEGARTEIVAVKAA